MTRHLISTSETWHMTEPRFLYHNLCWEENGNIHYAQHLGRHFDLNSLEGELVSKSDLYAKAFPETSGYTRAPNPLPESSYIKRPNVANFKGMKQAGKMMVTEIKACEAIRARPHPNLVEYRGYTCEDGYITALCLKKYKISLHDAVKKSLNLDFAAIVEDARNGMNHLHSLGLVHNDISPWSVMVDENQRGILVDFESCRPHGEKIPNGCILGTVGFMRHKSSPQVRFPSDRENDYYSLDKVVEWLHKETGATK